MTTLCPLNPTITTQRAAISSLMLTQIRIINQLQGRHFVALVFAYGEKYTL
jgi:hypothetical protein